ncbi:MAG: translation initiation factor IF-2, partial [Actinobacteria bacterium]|nr:translation initiation factor IF-2 [Actinomycetota bacterium]
GEVEDFTDVEDEKYAKKVHGKDKIHNNYGYRYLIDEEKKINIRKVLDKELDREEKEGRFRTKVKPISAKKKVETEKQGIKLQQVSASQHAISNLKEKVIKRPEIKKVIELSEGVTIKELSERIGIPSNEILQVLFNMGEMLTINQPIDRDIVEILSQEFNFKYSIIDFDESIEEIFKDSDKDMVLRPPIVTVMGHVDHGKTTLLDAIRKANVVSSEAGGITQKIGAYQITYNNRKITFIDTPGHEAFTTMRARGAKVTDIAVIVVAADDGIMPQTVEAINHAKEANVPIIVAINKIDLPSSSPEKVKQGLTEYGLVSEEWGGDTVFVSISAKNKVNIDELLEMITLVADLHELKGNPDAEGSGIIIESKLDKSLGPLGSVLVRRGKIKVGDFFVTGNSYGRVRTIRDEYGSLINEATLSQPVEISGFTVVPQAGDRLFIVKNEKIAKDSVSKREYQKKLLKLSDIRRHVTLEDLAELSKESEIKKLKIILKAESNGSMDAVEKALRDIEEEDIKIDIIHKAVGAISDSDILLASASDAIVIGFGVIPTQKAKVVSKEEDIEVRTYDIIYKLIDEIKLAFKGLLEPKIEEHIKGSIEVREVFKISKVGYVAGCYIVDGEVERGDFVRVLRGEKVIFDGKISSLHRFKEDVKKVSAGYECGIRIENFQDINNGDILEIYEKKTVKQ